MTPPPPSTPDWAAYAARGAGPRHVVLGSAVRHQLTDRVRSLGPRRIALLADATDIASPEGDLKAWVADQLASLAVPIDQVRLPASTTADEAAVEQATAGCAAADVVVTVGSGTISDIGKVAASGRPHVVVQTAASVNGYSDDESVLLKNGVKRTTHSAYADTLVIDIDVIALAPAALNRSGLGDMISMFTAPADWYLANQLGMDDQWSTEAALLARDHGTSMLQAAEGIGLGRPAELELLGSLLTLSGVSMGLAGQTSPSSGMEHTVSHMIDMWSAARGTQHRLHGAQVGVTTLWASLLWQRVIQRLDAGDITGLQPLSMAEAEAAVLEVFGHMDPSGGSGQECWSDYRVKLQRMHTPEFREATAAFLQAWPEHRGFLVERCLADPADIAAALTTAGAPARADDLDDGDRDRTVWALANNHFMRNRFNICDFAFAAGLWDRGVAQEIIVAADRLAGGAAR
ncbi:MAG: iron-containing alcohol dehydrogenase [Arachnia sp.]